MRVWPPCTVPQSTSAHARSPCRVLLCCLVARVQKKVELKRAGAKKTSRQIQSGRINVRVDAS